MIYFIIIVLIIVIGIIQVQDRFESEGLGRAFISLFCLFTAAIAILLCFTGWGSIIGIPIICCIGKFFASKI